VRFNGEQVWIRISSLHKSTQCGLCGNYNGDETDEVQSDAKGNSLMMDHNRQNSENQMSGMKKFHKSYSVQEKEECTPEEMNRLYERKFYTPGSYVNGGAQRAGGVRAGGVRAGGVRGQGAGNKEKRALKLEGDADKRIALDAISPIMKTKAKEFSSKICFSTTPVASCPSGSYTPADQSSMDIAKSVRFVCLQRWSIDARRLLRQITNRERIEARGGGVANDTAIEQEVAELETSLDGSPSIQQIFLNLPKRCVRPTNDDSNQEDDDDRWSHPNNQAMRLEMIDRRLSSYEIEQMQETPGRLEEQRRESQKRQQGPRGSGTKRIWMHHHLDVEDQ